MNNVPRNTQYAMRYTLYAIRYTKDYVRNYQRIMQNKPNFQKVIINVNSYMKSKYEKLDTLVCRKNKPNSNPIQTQFKPNSNPIKPNCRKCQNERK